MRGWAVHCRCHTHCGCLCASAYWYRRALLPIPAPPPPLSDRHPVYPPCFSCSSMCLHLATLPQCRVLDFATKLQTTSTSAGKQPGSMPSSTSTTQRPRQSQMLNFRDLPDISPVRKVRIVNMCGYDSVPSDLGAYILTTSIRER